jgi:hypothetical protein
MRLSKVSSARCGMARLVSGKKICRSAVMELTGVL